MKLKLALTATVVALMLAGCDVQISEPKIDASSDEALTASIAQVRGSLESEQRTEFDTLVGEQLMGAALANVFTGGVQSTAVAMQPFDGMTGDEFIVSAREEKAKREAKAEQAQKAIEAQQAEREAIQVKRDMEKLAGLEAKQATYDAEIASLANVEVEFQRFEKTDALWSYGRLDVRLTNNLDRAIKNLTLRAVVATDGREVPWVDQEIGVYVQGGIEPGESIDAYATGIEVGMSESALEENDGAELALSVVEVTFADGTRLPSDEMGAWERSEMKTLQAKLAEQD